jgi:peptidoglycan/LPS O-acetylase OafA/YrhL
LFNALYCIWVGLRKTKFSIHQTTPVPGWRSWLISAVILGLAEMEMSHFSNVWINLKETNLDGLGYQGMHLFTYGFLFAVGCKAASHRWIERINQRLAYSWFQASMLISLTLLAIMVATILVGNNSHFLQQAWPILSALIPFVGWGYIAMFLTWTQQHEHIGGAWLAKAGRDSFGAYLIHMPILYGCFMPLYLSGVTNIWVLSLSATISAIVLSFWGSHQLRNIPSIRGADTFRDNTYPSADESATLSPIPRSASSDQQTSDRSTALQPDGFVRRRSQWGGRGIDHQPD